MEGDLGGILVVLPFLGCCWNRFEIFVEARQSFVVHEQNCDLIRERCFLRCERIRPGAGAGRNAQCAAAAGGRRGGGGGGCRRGGGGGGGCRRGGRSLRGIGGACRRCLGVGRSVGGRLRATACGKNRKDQS